MHTLTEITLDNGEMALYLDGHYLGSEDGSGERMSLSDIAHALMNIPDVCMQTVSQPLPDDDEWSWNDVARNVFPTLEKRGCRDVTVRGFMTKLSEYPADALCCGTFWVEEDFLEVDSSLATDDIRLAMEVADHKHDANIGYNWDYLRWAVEYVKG